LKIAECHLTSISPYSQSKVIQSEKNKKELDKDFEARVWRERAHAREDRHIIIPPMQFANSLKEAAKYLNLQVPGQGKRTYTKNFEAGVLVNEPLVLPDLVDKVKGEWLFVPSDGQRGGGRRVMKCFPFIPQWTGKVIYWIADDLITEDVFMEVLRTSGTLIGIGRFRPRNLGYYGRFECDDHTWIEQ
jgi:hypothetical protein